MKRVFAILVCIDIVDSTKFVEQVGDMRASQAMRSYDRIFRGLLIKYNGLEIDKTDGALLLFETMREALAYVTDYHALIEHRLQLMSRVGIHCGHIIMHSNASIFVSRGAKPIEVDGIHKVITARIMSVARGGQTILSQRAGEYASSIRGKLYMRDIGVWKLKGVQAGIRLFALSANIQRLQLPPETSKVKLLRPPPRSTREIWTTRFKVWVVPHLVLLWLYLASGILTYMAIFQVIVFNVYPIYLWLHWLLRSIYIEWWQ